MLRYPVSEREAIDAIWNGGAWRERTAEDADAPLDPADRRTGEGPDDAAPDLAPPG
jgi:hypothetical protein